MNFGSVCSGIEAASVAWRPLGWQAAWFSEIEPFPCAVLAHHYPSVPNLGDMLALPERIRLGEIEAPDILCGGTPCQAFSVAGLRRSLGDARGNLSLTFCEIADAIDERRSERGEPEAIIFWENVPGVLNTADNAFGCFLAGLAGEDGPLEPPGGKWTNAGYVSGPKRAIAWRVLDAQYFGVAQRRRRVFVVASARDGFDPAAVLFEFEGVRRDSAPSRETGEVAPTIPARSLGGGGLGTDFDCDGGLVPEIARCDTTGEAKRQDWETCTIFALQDTSGWDKAQNGRGWSDDGARYTLDIAAMQGVCVTGSVAHTLKAEGFDASEDGTGRGQPIVVHGAQDPCVSEHTAFAHGRNNGGENAIAFNPNQGGMGLGDVATPIGASTGGGNQGCVAHPVEEPFTLAIRGRGDSHNLEYRQDGTANALLTPNGGRGGIGVGAVAVSLRGREGAGLHREIPRDGVLQQACAASEAGDSGCSATEQERGGQSRLGQTPFAVRRLTCEEAEFLQGFPRGYTKIPWRKKPAEDCPDGPRYKALGNSWAVPNVRWIGRRIQEALSC